VAEDTTELKPARQEVGGRRKRHRSEERGTGTDGTPAQVKTHRIEQDAFLLAHARM
jgi:hypothetical protein